MKIMYTFAFEFPEFISEEDFGTGVGGWDGFCWPNGVEGFISDGILKIKNKHL